MWGGGVDGNRFSIKHQKLNSKRKERKLEQTHEMRKYSSIYMYMWIYKYSASWLSLPENWPSSIYTHTHTHVFMFVFVFAVRVHSMCPVTFSSTTFWLSFWLILFCLLLLGCVCVCSASLWLAHSAAIYLFCLLRSVRKCQKANIAHTPRVCGLQRNQ